MDMTGRHHDVWSHDWCTTLSCEVYFQQQTKTDWSSGMRDCLFSFRSCMFRIRPAALELIFPAWFHPHRHLSDLLMCFFLVPIISTVYVLSISIDSVCVCLCVSESWWYLSLFLHFLPASIKRSQLIKSAWSSLLYTTSHPLLTLI